MSIVIVGGGLSGLTAANHLADAGHPVTLIEARSDLGGRARTDEQDGVLLNQGPHAIYLDGPGLAELRRLGVDPPGGRAGDGAHALDGATVGALPGSVRSLLRTPLLGWRDRAVVARVLTSVPRIDPSTLADRSTADWLAATLTPDRSRRLVGGLIQVATYCQDLERLSADVGVGQLQLALGGVRYVHGGWGTVVRALAERAERAGVRMRTGCHVRAVTEHADHVSVATDGGPLRAERVVVAGPGPRATARLLDDADLRSWADRQVPATVACLDVGLDELPEPSRRFAYGMDRPVYLSVHNPPANLGRGILIHVMRYLRPGERDPVEAVRANLEAVLDQVQPGWRDHVRTDRFLPRMTAATVMPTADQGGVAGRYPTVPPGLRRIAVAGDWVGPDGHLFDAALVSARRAAEAVLAEAAPAPSARPLPPVEAR